jgi:formate C-acetyltransferase
MNDRLELMKKRIRDHAHRSARSPAPIDVLKECEAEDLSWPRRVARLVKRQCEAERPVIAPEERIVFTRTLPAVPPVYSSKGWETLIAGRTIHELGPISNICADWSLLLSEGLSGRKEVALDSRGRLAHDPSAVEFLDCAIETMDAVVELTGRYEKLAKRMGKDDLAAILQNVPAHPARTFHESLQSLRIGHAIVWLGGNYHVGLGRFDQYMWPYLRDDLANRRLTVHEAEDLLAEFFLSLNKDSDLYPGVQQGDNGQSLTLGGVTPSGESAVNELTYMVLRVARDVAMIDPKINLRISAQTDLELLCLATELTRLGLGFPQYSNDDVVIPALQAHGYHLEDARNYVVAACWEFIIPGYGMEVVNIGAVSFPAAVDQALRKGLAAGKDFDHILALVKQNICEQVNRLAEAYSRLVLPPAPYFSIFMHGCLEKGRDVSAGLKYNNYGIHGAASANAADALAAVKKFIFEDHAISPRDLLSALEANYQDWEPLRRTMMEGPKVGNNDQGVDALLVTLFSDLAEACEAHPRTPRGGLLRPGTGSAMYYIWLAQGHEGMREPVVSTTADGRLSGEPFSANLAPSPGVCVRGPISTLQSFARIDYQRVYNGGPITMELSESVFRDSESIRKTAMLVRTFAQLGCQQLQLNSLSLATLLDARAHPENHKNLIVRVWGWSGYFCELAPEYQDHIIARHLYEIE